jgi:hypothetical protein
MTRTRFKTCFISAPLGVDTSVLRRTLEEKSIRWFDQTSLEPGGDWLDAIDRAVTRSDFMCVVLPEGQHPNILFELGIAYARRKPILAFVGSSSALPSDMLSLTYVCADPKNAATVQSTLATFLEHASDKPLGRTVRAPAKMGMKSKPSPPPPPSSIGQEFERRTAALLQEAGFIVSWPTERRDQGADLAVWIDELQHVLGNPLLVEVKAGDMSTARLSEAASRLREYVARTQGRCALLVYWDRRNREFPSVFSGWPLVFQLSGSALTRLVRRRRLPAELLRLRNAAVHSEV